MNRVEIIVAKGEIVQQIAVNASEIVCIWERVKNTWTDTLKESSKWNTVTREFNQLKLQLSKSVIGLVYIFILLRVSCWFQHYYHGNSSLIHDPWTRLVSVLRQSDCNTYNENNVTKGKFAQDKQLLLLQYIFQKLPARYTSKCVCN